MSEESNSPTCGWVKLYHSSGALVTLPVPCQIAELDCYKGAFAAVTQAVAAGFAVNQPGMEPGEEKEQIAYVLRREKTNQDNSTTPIIDLYSANEAVKFKVFSKYLNNSEAVEAFEKASGMSLDSLDVFPGTAAPERGSNKQSDRFIKKVPQTFAVVLKPNSKYDESAAAAAVARKEVYKVPKREFVRWDGQQPASDSPAANGAVGGKVNTESTMAVDQAMVKKWAGWCAQNPSLDTVNKNLTRLNNLDKNTYRAVWGVLTKYAETVGWEYSDQLKAFVPPVEADQGPANSDDVIPF